MQVATAVAIELFGQRTFEVSRRCCTPMSALAIDRLAGVDPR